LILPSEGFALGERAITTFLNVLGLTQLARAELKLTTFRLFQVVIVNQTYV
jgi:hypothetical protein